ncbi:type IIL restriction-modification enzyme MmeI [Polaromonas sp. DSR2-3-2]|uniref:type IIL restriction-modification enzyme MmeI n=1 Tax=unclassified Polaromonas TaxID=2638319 RepID=UPI003CF35AA6
MQAALGKGVAISFAIPDHPWVDSANGAAVRIAMTVGSREAAASAGKAAVEAVPARLLSVTSEQTGEFGEVAVTLAESTGLISADLSVGANVAAAGTLQSNENLSNRGVQLFGGGFMVTPEETALLLPLPLGEGWGEGQRTPQTIIRDYRNGRDLTDAPRGVKVIDLFGLSAEQARTQFPAVYQWLLERVKPERDQNNRATYRDNWWIHGEPRKVMRKQLADLPRYIATAETAKHRVFQFLDASILPDNKLIAIAMSDAFHLGVLSSRPHVAWAMATGSWLGVGNDSVYVKTRCFETFPFPDEDTGLTPELRQRIGVLAEQIDAHRKRQQAASPGLTLTGTYNVLEALREGRPLSTKEKIIHTQGLVSVLKELHDELDAAVLLAYGLTPGEDTDALLTHLVSLNASRAAEEKTGRIRWLRPAFQNPALAASLTNQELLASAPLAQQVDLALDVPLEDVPAAATGPQAAQPWPGTLPDQVRAVAHILAGTPIALPQTAIEACFKGRGPWKKSLPRILDTLEALGRARREGTDWRG